MSDILASKSNIVQLVELYNIAVNFISIGLKKKKSYKAKTFSHTPRENFQCKFLLKLKYFWNWTSDLLASNRKVVQLVELYNFAVELISIGLKKKRL